jgi:DNA segregation ATPase FtsK/SpoIIIE, S-DNA-T family
MKPGMLHPALSANVDLLAVPVGITDSRQWWRVPVLGHHLLIAGATGAGKGSVLWSLIAALGPCIKTGQVRLCVIDPKGGMELGAGAALFSAFSHDATDTTLDVLRKLVTVMHARANRLRGHTRLHTPTPSEPLFVVIIDEIAALTAYVTDRKIRTEIEHLLGLLLSQGRAVGISVVAAIQDPSKDTLPVRQLFTVRIGLRLTEASQTAMVLGQGARDAGAECDLIADTTPGVGYVMIDGTAQPQRVRAFHVTDANITDLTTRFSPPRAHRNGTEHSLDDAGPDRSNR